jgi:hypothetical protein
MLTGLLRARHALCLVNNPTPQLAASSNDGVGDVEYDAGRDAGRRHDEGHDEGHDAVVRHCEGVDGGVVEGVVEGVEVVIVLVEMCRCSCRPGARPLVCPFLIAAPRPSVSLSVVGSGCLSSRWLGNGSARGGHTRSRRRSADRR